MDEIIKSLSDGFRYPHISNTGYIQWYCSRSLTEGSLAALVRECEFVEASSKSDGLAISAEKTLDGTEIKKVSHLVNQFYDLYRYPKVVVPPRYRASEYSTALAQTAKSLNLQQARLTGDLMAVIGTDRMCEWEFITTICSRISMASNRPSFKIKVQERRKAVAGEYQRLSRYVNRLGQVCPDLVAHRFEIGYQSIHSEGINLQESAEHIEAFLHALKFDPSLGLPVGHWFVREYIVEVGYRYHLVLFFSPKGRHIDDAVFFRLGSRWNDTTKGCGSFFHHAYRPEESRSWGVGGLMDFMGGNQKLLLRSLKLMLERDRYLWLEPSADFDHYGMGELPRLAKQPALPDFVQHTPSPSMLWPTASCI
jgi:hypothetical protein